MRSSLLSFILLILCACLPGQAQGVPTEQTTLEPQQVATRLAEARARLEALPKGEAAGSQGALLRPVWERRVQLLEDAAEMLARSQAQDAIPEQVEERKRTLAGRQAEHEALPALAAPDSPTEEGLAALEARVDAQRERVNELRTVETEKSVDTEKIPMDLAEAQKRLQSALERATRLTKDSGAATDPDQKEALGLRAENAALDATVARLKMRVLERTREQEKILAPLRLDERELAARRLERLEQEYGLYTEELGQAIDRETLRLDAELKRLAAAVENAQGPAARFVATKQLEIAQFKKNEGEHGRFLLSLRSDLEEQQRRLMAEADELTGLRAYLEKAGAGEQAGDRMRFTMQRVKLRGQALGRTLRRDIAGELADYRSRRLELEDRLFFLKENWEREVESTTRQLGGPEGAAFAAAASGLFAPYRTALRDERDLLTDVIGAGEKLQLALIERRDALDALEWFIRSQVFWIRDARPLGPEVWPHVVAESAVVSRWARDLGSPEARDRVSATFKRPGVVMALLFLVLALPLGLFWARQRLRRVVKRLNDRTLGHDARIIDRVLAIVTGVASVALLPIYLLVASRLALAADLPETLAPVVSTLLEHLAVFVFFLFLSRSFFAGRGTAQVQFGMDRDAAHALHRSLRIALLGYLVFFSLRSILSRPPFLFADGLPLETLPRIAHTLFLVFAVLAGVGLLQHRSAFSRYWAASLGDRFVGRRWPILTTLGCVAAAGIVVLDITGYRYGAGVLARSLAGSVVVLLLLVPAYKGLVAVIASVVRRRRASRSTADTEESTGQTDAAVATDGPELQVRTFLRVCFAIGGVVAVASLWGLDMQTLGMLDDLKLYDVRASEEFVSWGDALRTVLYLVGTYLLLKYLPGIYEYTIFPRLTLDAGLKYAILTMSRYGLFTMGVILALSEIHLDLGRLGWLMAAMGVGLGFGLQEIVSNFVSGIILLVERPVRVGDVVTVGATSGKVQRINIRATTVLNFDRQEIIVPNRSLITKEVTNWTRGDTIIRMVVPIGVAYGSDVDQVTDMLLDIARRQPDILTEPPPQAFFMAHGESSLDFELRVFIPDPSVKMPLLHRLNKTINRSLADQGIEIPFPQRDLHVRSSAVAWPEQGSAEAIEREPSSKRPDETLVT